MCQANNYKFYRKVLFLIFIHAACFALAYGATKNMKPVDLKVNEKTILCDPYKSQVVKIGYGRVTILNFPLTPKEVLPGEQVFDFKQIKNDLAIKALRPSAKTNVAIYLSDRRCSFELSTVIGRGDDILFVHDPKDQGVEVKFHE